VSEDDLASMASTLPAPDAPGRVMPFDRWEHQWLRAWRWHRRTLVATGRETGRGSWDAEDFSEALAQAVWHLKDWLKNDPRQRKVSDQQIEEFTKAEPVLLVLADLCNGSKHAFLKSSRAAGTRFGNAAWIGDGDYDDETRIGRVYVTVSTPAFADFREVVDVARLGLEAWATWLSANGLDLPDHE
jgi:hypothetical protein